MELTEVKTPAGNVGMLMRHFVMALSKVRFIPRPQIVSSVIFFSWLEKRKEKVSVIRSMK